MIFFSFPFKSCFPISTAFPFTDISRVKSRQQTSLRAHILLRLSHKQQSIFSSLLAPQYLWWGGGSMCVMLILIRGLSVSLSVSSSTLWSFWMDGDSWLRGFKAWTDRWLWLSHEAWCPLAAMTPVSSSTWTQASGTWQCIMMARRWNRCLSLPRL